MMYCVYFLVTFKRRKKTLLHFYYYNCKFQLHNSQKKLNDEDVKRR